MKLPALKNKSVAVIGCGGLGNNVLAHLAGCGVGTVYFCDCDAVEPGNLDRQFLYSHADVGKNKTDCMAAFFARYAPEIKAVPVQKKIRSAEDLAFARGCDLMVMAADNNAVRRAAQRFCTETGTALVNGGVQSYFGTAYLYVPGKSPCLSCAGLLAGETADIQTVSSTVGMIGALCAELAVRYLTGDAEAGALYIYDHTQIEKLNVRPSPSCGVCKQIKEMTPHG